MKRVGYYIPLSITSAVIVAVASGLISTFSPGTSTGKWIGYQILLGAGRGLGLQMVRSVFPIADLYNPLTLVAAAHRRPKHTTPHSTPPRHGARHI